MNKRLFKLHRWAAIAAAVPLLVICATGSALVFKHEIDAWLMHDTVRVTPSAAGRQPMETLLAVLNQALPQHEVTGWAWFADDPQRADVVYVIEHGTKEWQYTLLNPYNGDLLSQIVSTESYLTDWLLSLHYTLLVGEVGMLISGLFAILLCLLGITGIWLHRRFWKGPFKLRWSSGGVVAYSDLHKLVGIVGAPVLLILGVTGAWWNIEHGLEEIAEHWGGEAHPAMESRLYAKHISLDDVIAQSEAEMPGFEATYLRLPWEAGIPIAVFGRVPTGNPLSSDYSSTVLFDSDTGDLSQVLDIRQTGLVPRIEDTFRALHFGTFGGLTTRILWAVLGSAPLALVITGLWLWWHRRSKRLAKGLPETRNSH
ncbi:MAG: PepSY domain-containing protein [Gammaproteobacteria bacterium]|nr:PepSY domain-containing protein [Gammaproteobacteria bacterium]